MGTKRETRSTGKKVTASDSAKPGPHIHIFFFNSGVTGTRRNGDKERKSMYVCVCVYVCVYVTLFCWRLFHLISPRSEVTFGSDLVW